jgi:hypothetical protein
VNYIDSKLKNTTVKNLKMMDDFTLHCLIFNNGDENTGEVNEIKALSHSIFRVGKNKLRAECKSCTACNFFSTYNLAILGSVVTGNNVILYRILLPGKIGLKALQKELEKNSIKYQIVEYYYKNSVELTEREKFVINKLYESKYFESQRSSTLTDIAKSINIIIRSCLSITLYIPITILIDFLITVGFRIEWPGNLPSAILMVMHRVEGGVVYLTTLKAMCTLSDSHRYIVICLGLNKVFHNICLKAIFKFCQINNLKILILWAFLVIVFNFQDTLIRVKVFICIIIKS